MFYTNKIELNEIVLSGLNTDRQVHFTGLIYLNSDGD